jgi:hypothetical protein
MDKCKISLYLSVILNLADCSDTLKLLTFKIVTSSACVCLKAMGASGCTYNSNGNPSW